MSYDFKNIEPKWQKFWSENEVFKAENKTQLKKYYIMDMFPYPSGAGLHVGHPLGYIASDIFSRYKRQKGFNVLHPQGYDSFGLPAEQYAIKTGRHPAKTTAANNLRARLPCSLLNAVASTKSLISRPLFLLLYYRRKVAYDLSKLIRVALFCISPMHYTHTFSLKRPCLIGCQSRFWKI